MNSKDPNPALPANGEVTAEEQAAYLAFHKSQFDPLEAAREYREMLEKGGVTWEQLMQEFDDVDSRPAASQPRST